jgi:hypothetical protein
MVQPLFSAPVLNQGTLCLDGRWVNAQVSTGGQGHLVHARLLKQEHSMQRQ